MVGSQGTTAVALLDTPVTAIDLSFLVASVLCLETSGDIREAYLSTQQSSTSAQAWFPRPNEHPRGTRRPEVPPCQGPSQTLGLIDRIRERDTFIRLRREGTRVRINPLWCSSVPDPNVSPPRVAFAIGRAVGSAVTRNRLRRRLRALLEDFDVPPGIYLFGASPHACELTFEELRQRLTRLMVATTNCAPQK
jgi:ribonuclease P protein component